MNEIFTTKQQLIINEIKLKQPRILILEGAVRSGKTILGISYWIAILKRHKNKLFIMTGQTISSLKRNVLDEIENLFGIDTHLNARNEWSFNSNKIACFGSDKSDSYKSMRGLTAQGWYANEIILSHQNTILEAFARCSQRNCKIIWETNPDKPSHYIKTNYINRSGQTLSDGTINILSFHFTLEDNTFLDKNYIESLKQNIPRGTLFDRMIFGQWKANEQAIYNNYKIINELPQSYDDCCFGLDFGYNNPSALVKCIYKDNDIYIQCLLYESHLTNNMLCDRVKQIIENSQNPIYCDSAEPDKIRDLRNAGLNVITAMKNVKEGINAVKSHKLYLLNDNTNLISEFENYEWRKNSGGEILDEPIKISDHAVDAVRYAVYTHNKNKFSEISKSMSVTETFKNFEF